MRQSIINKLNSNNMSKKVIEQEIEPDLNIELLPDGTIYVKPMFPYTDVYIEESVRTTVAKAICPEYQKVIDEVEFLRAERPVNIAIRNENKTLKDQNAKLVEALEKVKKDMEWMWENLSKPHTPDHFNIPANAIQEIELTLQNTKNIEG